MSTYRKRISKHLLETFYFFYHRHENDFKKLQNRYISMYQLHQGRSLGHLAPAMVGTYRTTLFAWFKNRSVGDSILVLFGCN